LHGLVEVTISDLTPSNAETDATRGGVASETSKAAPATGLFRTARAECYHAHFRVFVNPEGRGIERDFFVGSLPSTVYLISS